MLDFSRFSLSNMVECGSALRSLGDRAGSMEDVAGRIVAQLDDWFRSAEPSIRNKYGADSIALDDDEQMRRLLHPIPQSWQAWVGRYLHFR